MRAEGFLWVAFVLRATSAVSAPDDPFHKLDLSTLSDETREDLKAREASILKHHSVVSAQISKWHDEQKDIIRAFKEKKEKEFAAHLRKMHCNKLKRSLLTKADVAVKQAKRLARERKQKALEQEAVERAKEILGKVGQRERTMTGQLLGEAKVRYKADPKDAKYWLHALRTSDPQWQRRENRKLRHIQRTDPNWRSKQDNDAGDGGYSWVRKLTRRGTAYDRHPESQLSELAPIDLIETAVVQLPSPATSGEETPVEPAMEPAPDDSKKEYEQPFSEESPDEDEAQVLRRQAEMKVWLANEHQNVRKFANLLAGNLSEWRQTQEDEVKRMYEKRGFFAFCTKSRNTMQEHLADIVLNLPISDDEKSEYEKPLLADMEEWLKCEKCKKPVVQREPGQPPPKPWR